MIKALGSEENGMEHIKSDMLIEQTGVYIYVVDYSNYKIIYTNNNLEKKQMGDSVFEYCYELIFGNKSPCEDCPMQRIGEEEKGVWALKGREGSNCNIFQYKHMNMPDGTKACVIASMDVTGLQDAIQNMERVLDSIHAAAYTINIRNHTIKFLNKELKNMLPDVKKGDLCYKALWDNEVPCDFCPLSGEEREGIHTHLNLYNQKLNRHLSIDVADLKDADGERIGIFTAYDISRLIESENRLKQVAYIDTLTNMKNRTAFLEDLTQLFDHKISGSICILNIKHLNKYNLFYGKKMGDDLIKQVASLYSMSYLSNKVYRIDGAKIAFIAEGESEIQHLKDVMKNSEKEFMEKWDNPSFHICFDKAFIEFPNFASNAEQVVFNAEYMLKKYSNTTQSKILEYNGNEERVLKYRNRIEEILQNSEYTGCFHVYYQPIYNIETNSYSKCEALLRLYDDKIGWISPVEFIPIAEENGYIGRLGEFVLQEVCCFLANRKKEGLPPINININISAMELAASSFFESVVSTVERFNVSPEFLQLEITESILASSIELVVNIMQKLIDYGFSFAIDDFGTGYSNLSYIGVMPIECLKLDKSFMDMLLGSKAYQLIVTNIIEIAKGLKLSIVAEGIESQEQYEVIKKLGSNYIQGFLFSKPLPVHKFEEFLVLHNNQKREEIVMYNI